MSGYPVTGALPPSWVPRRNTTRPLRRNCVPRVPISRSPKVTWRRSYEATGAVLSRVTSNWYRLGANSSHRSASLPRANSVTTAGWSTPPAANDCRAVTGAASGESLGRTLQRRVPSAVPPASLPIFETTRMLRSATFGYTWTSAR